MKFVGHRRVDNYCQGGFGEEESLETVVRAINDCVAVFISRIGNCPREGLLKAGIRAGGSLCAGVHRAVCTQLISESIWSECEAERSNINSAATPIYGKAH